jgi:hypothetical protein
MAAWAFGSMLAMVAPASSAGPDADTGERPPTTLRAVLFSGIDGVEGARYMYGGIVAALNRDLSRDGFLVRLYGSHVDFALDPGEGRGWQGDFMFGYKFARGGMWGSILAGIDYQDFKLSPDNPAENVRGTEIGVKVAGDLSTAYGSPFYAALSANYSTAFEAFWARARVGVHRDNFTFGPEGIVMGNEGFDARRLGGFITWHNLGILGLPPFDLTVSAGHQFVGGNTTTTVGGSGGGEGTYGAISFSTAF